MIKKILKITGLVLLVLLLSLIAIPFFFKDQIKEKITAALNEKVDAKISFAEADLSLFRSFPRANVRINKLLIINKAPFEGDTLISFGEIDLKMSVKELFRGKDQPMNIESISTDNGLINIIFNKDGIGNFDIALKDESEQDQGKSSPLSLKIKEYKITNLRFKYFDESSKIRMTLDSLNHSGTGDFANAKLDLKTQSDTKVSLTMDKANYMDHVPLKLDAIIGIDLDQSKYTFKENKALINQLPLEFDGFIQLVENGQQYDLKFKTPTSSFQNFLGVLPAAYSSGMKDVKTTGEFTVKGFANGLFSDTTVPKFNIEIASDNASFQYPDLPKSVQNIVIDTKIINQTGNMNDTYVDLNKLSFRIDQDVFNAKANIRNVAENALVDAQMQGTINLGNVSKAYPVKLKVPLSGLLKADLTTKFDMQSVEKNQYERMQNSGSIILTGFKYVDEHNKAMNINKAMVQFTNTRINLQELDMTTGKTDMRVSGVIDNLYGFMLKKQELKGSFNLQSNQFAVSDFMTAEKPQKESQKPSQSVKVPSYLDCTLTARANSVLYDNLNLKNVSGKLRIKDQKVSLENIQTDIFGGQITATGDVSTKEKTPVFHMNLGLKSVDIQQTFSQLEMLKKIAPIAEVLDGKINTSIKLSGNLNAKEMTPEVNSLSGDLSSQLLSTTVNPSKSALLSKLSSDVSFLDLKKLNLKDLKTAMSFSNGKVNIKPFELKYQDIKVNVGGQHGFDQNMSYNLKFDVPAKYLGPEVNKLLAKVSPSDLSKLENIPITALVTGNFKNPKVNTDMKAGITNLAAQLVKQQKEKLVKQGTNALEDLIQKNTKSDTTKTKSPVKEDIKKKAGELLNGLFKK